MFSCQLPQNQAEPLQADKVGEEAALLPQNKTGPGT